MENRIWSRSLCVIVILVTLLGLGDITSPQTTSCVIGTYDCTGNAPCAPNYVRAGVGVCVRNGGTVPTFGFSIGTSCTAIDLSSYGLTSTARSATLTIDRYLIAGTAAGIYWMDYRFYSDSSCTTLLAPNFAVENLDPVNPTDPNITYPPVPLYPYRLMSYTTLAFAGATFFQEVTSATVYLNGQTTIYGIRSINVPAAGRAEANVIGVSAYYD